MAGHYIKTNDGKENEIGIDEYEKLFHIILHGADLARGKAMMYYKEKENTEYEPVPSIRQEKSLFSEKPQKKPTTRGKHMGQVALIAVELAKRLEGDQRIAMLIGLGHDFGHSTLAHTGEAAIGRFLLSPDKFLPWKGVKSRDGFDHAQHSLRKLKKVCREMGIELPKQIANGIEAHSTGDSQTGKVSHKSLESECVMRADKIASAVSDTQDMILAGVLDVHDEESLKKNLDENPKVRAILKQRLFSEAVKDMEKYVVEYFGGEEAYQKMLKDTMAELSEDFPDISEEKLEGMAKQNLENIVEAEIQTSINHSLEYVKAFLQNSPAEQREKLISNIVDETLKQSNGELNTQYGDNYKPQLKVPKHVEAVLGALRGLLIGKENVRTLGKEGAEVEGLVETVLRYVYAHESEFEQHEIFQWWKTDENGEELPWEERVAYSIGDLSDVQFKNFAIELLEIEEAREALKHCKYRDPRDEDLEKKTKGGLEYSEADYSTKEAIESAFTIDPNRTYRPSISDKRGNSGQGGMER